MRDVLGSHESYVRAILSPTCTPVEEGGLGYRGVVVNFRGCESDRVIEVHTFNATDWVLGAGVPITSPQFYSAGYTDDIRVAILYISKRYPRAPLIGVGFSLGANVLTRYLAEEGNHCRLMAGCVLACVSPITVAEYRVCYHSPFSSPGISPRIKSSEFPASHGSVAPSLISID